MVKFGALLLWLLALAPAAAQSLPPTGPRTCATQQADAYQQALLQKRRPGYRTEKRTVGRLSRTALSTAAATTYTLPVIVHIIADGEPVGTGTNLSQRQVQAQLDVLNEDYRNRNADGASVPGPFQLLRADAQFQFVLARRGPGGQALAEPGIDRVNRRARGFDAPPFAQAYIESTIKPATDWDPEQYVNIWVLDLKDQSLGYGQYPDNTAGLAGLSELGGAANTDGVVVRTASFGRGGSAAAPFDQGRTLTHELGHFLGLRHTWGDADCGDDYCADTPPQQGPNYGCPTFPHLSCGNGPNGDLFQDFLDYTDDACMALFSPDQKARMQAVLAAGTPRRAGLLTSPALCTGPPLAATAATDGPVCAGYPATLRATGPAGASYDWSGPGGFVSTRQNPVLPAVAPAMAGSYTVRVTVTTGACPGQASTTLVVNPAPPTPVLAASDTTFCPGAGVGITLRVTNPLPGGRYTWAVLSGDGLPAGTATPTIRISPTQSATYQVTVSLPDGICPTATATVRVRAVVPVWSGAAGTGNWFEAANWQGCVPSRHTDALIPAGLPTPYPTLSGGTAEVRTLTQQGGLTLAGGELALYGDLAGRGPFTQTGGLVATRGAGAQRLRPATYQALLVGGSGLKTIGGGVVSQTLTLDGPVLRTDSVLTLGPAATLLETDASYVRGQVQTTRVAGVAIEAFGGLGVRLSRAAAAGPITVRRTTGQAQGTGMGLSISRYYDISPTPPTSPNPDNPLGTTLALAYLPHELNGLPAGQLTLFQSADGGATWADQGATRRDPAAGLVRRDYVAALAGRWTLASPAAPPPVAAITYSISAFPVPFTAEGLAIQVTTATAGPLDVQLYDVLGRALYRRAVASVEVGTSVVSLAGSGRLAPGKYVLVVRQGTQMAKLNVVRE